MKAAKSKISTNTKNICFIQQMECVRFVDENYEAKSVFIIFFTKKPFWKTNTFLQKHILGKNKDEYTGAETGRQICTLSWMNRFVHKAEYVM